MNENATTDDIPNITKTEKRIILALSKSAYTAKELSVLLKATESAIRNHLSSLREKGLISDICILKNPPTKIYFCNDLVESI